MKTIIIDGIEYNLTPKVLFKKGDFVVIQETTYQITKVENLNVTLSLNGRECIFDIDVLKNAHLWTIQDAKDGDVVVDKSDGAIGIFQSIGHHPDGGSYNDPSYCFLHCHCDDGFFYADFENGNEIDSDDLIPATKEQRDLLFQKMKEAGYEWDAEKKELKKIEQKPAWSEEDEMRFNNIFTLLEELPLSQNWLKSLKDRVQPQPRQEWSEEDENIKESIITGLEMLKDGASDKSLTALYNKKIEWLKSIRPQSQWKPSEGQLEALKKACDKHWEPDGLDPLYTLYQDLKKLKE